MTEHTITLTIDWTPPSVNHYKEPTSKKLRDGNRVKSWKLSPEAKAFRDIIALKARGRSITPETKKERDQVRYALYVTIYLGAGERGDGDNFWKCIADSLQKAGVIHSDARVRRWHLDVEDCDRENPRTEIRVERIERRLV